MRRDALGAEAGAAGDSARGTSRKRGSLPYGASGRLRCCRRPVAARAARLPQSLDRLRSLLRPRRARCLRRLRSVHARLVSPLPPGETQASYGGCARRRTHHVMRVPHDVVQRPRRVRSSARRSVGGGGRPAPGRRASTRRRALSGPGGGITRRSVASAACQGAGKGVGALHVARGAPPRGASLGWRLLGGAPLTRGSGGNQRRAQTREWRQRGSSGRGAGARSLQVKTNRERTRLPRARARRAHEASWTGVKDRVFPSGVCFTNRRVITPSWRVSWWCRPPAPPPPPPAPPGARGMPGAAWRPGRAAARR